MRTLQAERDATSGADLQSLILAAADLEPSRVEAILAPYGIRDAPQADRVLQALADIASSRERFAAFLPKLLEAASRAPDPDTALLRLLGYLEKRVDPANFFESAARIPDLLTDLMFAFGGSEYLSAILVRHPDYLSWLMESLDTPGSTDPREYADQLRASIGRLRSGDAKRDALRRFKRRETLRIGMRDLLGLASVGETTGELAAVADAAFQSSFEFVREEVEAQHGTALNEDGSPATFCVIGMGKLGGNELNFSSDVDVLFVYSEDGDTTQGESNQVYFQRVSERLIDALSAPTQEGYVFRVDLKLRPQGSAAPLARSLDSYEGFYETWGELFDRQALIKARFVAGDQQLASSFLSMVQPFVYRSMLDADELDDIREEIHATKLRIEERIAGEGDPTLHVKLGPGGIRDAEFIVQAMQLLFGGSNRSLRLSGSLETIVALTKAGHLSEKDARQLRDSYCFMRRVENFIQLVADRQAYSLPEAPEEWNRHARRLGYDEPAGAAFREDFARHRAAIRGLFDRFFDVGDDSFRRRMNRLLDETEPSEPTAIFLESYGIADAKSAHRALNELARGAVRVRFTPRVRRAFREFAQPLLEELSATPDPMLALSQFERFLSASHARAQYYAILEENPSVRQLLIRILGTSRFLGDILARDPVTFEALIFGAAVETRVGSTAEFRERIEARVEGEGDDLARSIQRFRCEELLRIGARDVLGESDVLETTKELSLLAESILRYYAARVYEDLEHRRGTPLHEDGSPATYCIVGMGKLAGLELNYSSDLDTQFVYSGAGRTSEGEPNAEFFARFARTIAAQWKRPVLGSSIYDLDMRLRPYGRGGPMALALDGYADYYRDHAEFWERQAAVKCRPVAGDEALGRLWSELAANFAYAAPLTPEEATEVYNVRARKEDKAARETSRTHNIKSGYGGLVDIEFLVQALQMRHGAERAAIRSPNTLAAIEALTEIGALNADAAASLRDAYIYLRRVEDRLQIVENRPMSALPDDDESLSKLALRLDYANVDQFLAEYHERTERVRETFDNIFKELGAKVDDY